MEPHPPSGDLYAGDASACRVECAPACGRAAPARDAGPFSGRIGDRRPVHLPAGAHHACRAVRLRDGGRRTTDTTGRADNASSVVQGFGGSPLQGATGLAASAFGPILSWSRDAGAALLAVIDPGFVKAPTTNL